VIGVNVRIEYVSNRPSTPARDIEIDVDGDRWIDYCRVAFGTDDIREAALTGAANLNDLNGWTVEWHSGLVPRQAPGFHPTRKRSRIESALLK
jgi:hypothetical protein